MFLNPNEEDILDTNLDELSGAVLTLFNTGVHFLNIAEFFLKKKNNFFFFNVRSCLIFYVLFKLFRKPYQNFRSETA
jgi:hypothetical protein